MESTNTTKSVILQTMIFLANQHTDDYTKEKLYNIEPGSNFTDVAEIKCYGVYGCFPITSEWYSQEFRPLNRNPKSPDEIPPRFPVFTNESRTVPKYLNLDDPDYVQQLGIDPTGNMYFVTHGYVDAGARPWVQHMINELLDEDIDGKASVIVVDWQKGSPGPYVQTCANIRLMGAITTHAIFLLYEKLKLPNLNKVHMIGHSLGAHLCGYAGYTLQRDFNLTLGRITGLDPAGVFFSRMPNFVHLDRTDALYVDIIHTAARPFAHGGLGMVESVGHVDFYPNGGFSNPGCDRSIFANIEDVNGSFSVGFQNYVSCDHLRSYEFFTASINPKSPFYAITCDSYKQFKNGECFECDVNDHFCFEFGFHSYRSYRHHYDHGIIRGSEPIKAYLITSDRSPFYQTHYKTTVSVLPAINNASTSPTQTRELGVLLMTVHSADADKFTDKIKFTKQATYYEPGATYVYISPGGDVGVPRYATLNWEYKSSLLNPFTWTLMSPTRVHISWIILESMEHRSRIRLCAENGEPVISGKNREFREEYCDPQ